jgi:hypothetical protein
MYLMEKEHFEGLTKDVQEMKALLKKEKSIDDFPELLRTSDIKRILKLKDSSLATLRQNGTLPFTKIGGTVYFIKSDILKLVKENYSGAHEK